MLEQSGMSFFLVLCLLAICGFAPGFFFVRRLRWSPMEKLCGSIGLSLALLYLASWAIYLIRPPGGPAAWFLVSGVCAAAAIAARRDIGGLLSARQARRELAGYGFLLAWTLVILSMIRIHSGAGWSIDWMEHFQRVLYFLHRFPTSTPVWVGYELPARPPMMNVLGAFFLGQAGDQFAIHQVVFTALNLLLFLACCLMLPALAGRVPGRRGLARGRVLALTAFFAASPLVMENATYPWTKSLAAFYAVLALWFYLAGWRKNDGLRITAAFVALAAGLLVHYSLGPYCALLGLHYLARIFWRRPRKWRELGVIVALCGVLLATWFAWSLTTFGWKTTFQSNTSVTSSQRYGGNNLVKMGANLFDSVVPAVVRNPGLFRMFKQPSRAGFVRDVAFLTYQVSLIPAMGLVGGPLVIWLLYRAFRRRDRCRSSPWRARQRSFWLWFVLCIVPLGIVVVGERDSFGVAHLTLIPMEALGITMVAAAFPWRRSLAIALLAGCAIDFGLGVYLHARIESLENIPGRTRFQVAFDKDGRPGPSITSSDSPAIQSASNWYAKHEYEIGEEYLRELPRRRMPDAASLQFWLVVYGRFQAVMDGDEVFWHGWFARHNNQIRHVGDMAADYLDVNLDTPAAALILLFVALMGALARETFRTPTVAIRQRMDRRESTKSSRKAHSK
jgi:hypothetical protein